MRTWVKPVAIVTGVVAASMTSCTYYLPHQIAASNVPLNPPDYEVVGPAAGEACRSYFLYIPVGGNNRLQAAIDDSLQKAGGDALIEVTTDYKLILATALFQKECTLVNGVAVKRKDGGRGKRRGESR